MSAQPSDTPLLDLLGRMTVDSMETSGLDEQTLMLVRVAALVAVDAPPASYLLNLGAAGDVGVTTEQVMGVLAAVAPIVGTTRVVAAAGRMVKALGAAVELAELAEYADAASLRRPRAGRLAGDGDGRRSPEHQKATVPPLWDHPSNSRSRPPAAGAPARPRWRRSRWTQTD